MLYIVKQKVGSRNGILQSSMIKLGFFYIITVFDINEINNSGPNHIDTMQWGYANCSYNLRYFLCKFCIELLHCVMSNVCSA